MIATLLLLAATPEQDTPFAWLAGKWCTGEESRRSRTCEDWRAGPGGSMRGMTQRQHERMTEIAENMEIRRDGDAWVYHAEPHGQAPADFRSVTVEGQAATFENRTHDYPQRIRYWREGEVLMAEISQADGGKPMRWEYRRVAD